MIMSFLIGPSHGNQSAPSAVKRNRHQRASAGEQFNVNSPIHSPLSETQFGGDDIPQFRLTITKWTNDGHDDDDDGHVRVNDRFLDLRAFECQSSHGAMRVTLERVSRESPRTLFPSRPLLLLCLVKGSIDQGRLKSFSKHTSQVTLYIHVLFDGRNVAVMARRWGEGKDKQVSDDCDSLRPACCTGRGVSSRSQIVKEGFWALHLVSVQA
ncbi:hypothetical protein CPAR01_01263 [Colletotrichum paranaense]|uniref:Uncharacterized protein n=1 Tax=Colletotrichum paranaense TaxID=1914294 RepID=A0ABQ9T825_9PEZI|nr:uncharacterized protein CPAR01_01263 [Colletotrichum paranaense]KAK1547296.1 hypothetical protein CPAR01_01263 [Colletotrichum paranaense]